VTSRVSAALGIELGSTRIKAVLIGPDHASLAVGGHDWENAFVDRLWTYPLEDAWEGLRSACAALGDLGAVDVLGVSAMMHGYLAFDADGELLTPFRTWRNTSTGAASEQLSERLGQNIPHRWSVAHLYQALLDHEEHVERVAFVTTLAGYVHWQLTGDKVIGVGDASGMFPIDPATQGYDEAMLATFDSLAADLGLRTPLLDLLPTIRYAGEPAGALTAAGAARLDPSGRLRAGVPLCPPEGDAGTGMVATS
jgi:sugar (pentulose or hexulose) kinase